MYEFAVFWLLALAVWKVGDLVNLWAVRNRPLETLVLLALGVGAAEALQWNILEAYGQDVTAVWVGVIATGLGVGAAASVLRTGSAMLHALIHRVDADVLPFDSHKAA